MKKLADDCFLHDKDRMKHAEAIDLLKSRMETIVETETVHLANATGRILAENVTAPRDIPAFDNSAVDGYAFAFDEHQETGGYFPVSGRIAAGDTTKHELEGFSAARIFTGAKMPEGADTVAMQEDCTLEDRQGKKFVAIPQGLKRGANCRRAGEDVEIGSIVTKCSTQLNATNIAAIASTGTEKIQVFKPLKIGLLSSGNEILRPGEPFDEGKVYDANHFMLGSLLENSWNEVTDLGVISDNAANVQTVLQEASKTHDIIISTGGASRGEEDHFVNALDALGSCHMWQIAVKPGRPMSFGQIGNTPCFTLPGNPVAAFVCFLLYVRPALICLAGGAWKEPQRYPVPADFEIRSKPDRREFLRGFPITDKTGETRLKKFERDGSGLITGLRQATGLIEVPEATTTVAYGDLLNFLPFSELID